MTARDPRTDPRPGDRLKLGEVNYYRVDQRLSDVVFYGITALGGYAQNDCSLRNWQRHMADATIISRGPDD